MGNPEVEKSEGTNEQTDSNTKYNSKQQTVEKANEHPEWLPDGWNVEFRIRKSGAHMGSGYKCYIDPLNGYKFYSKPEVLRYLETIKDNSYTSKKEKKGTNVNVHSPNDDVVKKSTVEDLPPGWVKEVKIRKNSNGIRKDPFYNDPVSGYVFRSKKDVLRYLESGDIRSCAFKPSRRQIHDEDNLTPSPAAKRQKPKQPAPKQQHFVATEMHDKSSIELPDAPVPMGESVVKMYSLEDGAANSSEMKKTSDLSSSAPLEKESLKESGKVLTADDVPEKEHVVSVMENANEKNHSNHSISKNKVFNVPHRSSPRLAGIKPSQASNVINEQSLQIPKRNLRKSRNTLDIDMENKSSQQFNGVQEIEHVHKMQQEVMNTSNNISEDQAVSKEQPHQQETGKIEDNKPEIQTASNKSSNKKKHHIPRRTSRRLAGFEHEVMNSVSCEEATKYKSKKSKDAVKAELQQSEGGPVTVIADGTPLSGKLVNKRKKYPKITSAADKQLEKHEDEEMDNKSEPGMSFAFHYSWSDPTLEFAINTLTGVLPSVEDAVDNRPTTVPETDIQETSIDNVTGSSRYSQNTVLDTVTERRDRNYQVRSSKPKRKKELKVPMRLSKRLAGLEPEVPPSERAVEYSSRKSSKEPTATATASLTNGVSDHPDVGEETKITLQASDNLKTEVPGESSNKSKESYNSQTVNKEQLQKVDAENIGDERLEPQLPLTFVDSWSDPCLEFAIKTLTGALPVDAGVDILPVMTPEFDDLPYKESHGSVVASINEEAHDNSNKSQNKKELNMVSQPELRTDYTSLESGPEFTIRESYVDQGNIIRNLNGEPRHIDAGNITQPVHHSGNINTLTHEEPLKENRKAVESKSVTTEQQLLEPETINHDSSELEFCASFMNSWSDPCLEFAFKTLTGVIPVEENLTIQGCVQEPAHYNEQRDNDSMLPDFGSASFSQSDISFHFDTGVKSMPGQQSSMNSPFLPLEKASLPGCAGVDPHKHCSQCDNNFQRR